MRRTLCPIFLLAALACTPALEAQVFRPRPAVALEAEDFTVEKGWKVLANGQGNYMVDVIGFCHISGERLLAVDGKDETASAHHDVDVPEAGPYRLWVRYEYPAFCETRFRVRVVQDGREVVNRVMGTTDRPRGAFGDPVPKAQHDPSWGPEGLMIESVDVPALKKGKARIYLQGEAQPQEPGVAAGRHIDLVYLTSDVDNAWLTHYRKGTRLYPILDAFRDTRGPRWEARFTNRGAKPAGFSIGHVYNRIPWGASEGQAVAGVAPGASSAWVPLAMQDTCHFGLTRFTSSGEPFEVALRPAGGTPERTLSGPSPLQVYLPPYAGKGDRPVTPVEEIDAVLAELKRRPAIGRRPTAPLCYGGWIPLGLDSDVGRKYAELYAALGFRSLHPAHSGPKALENLKAVGIEPTQSWAIMGYRNPPLPENIERARASLARDGLAARLRFFDYGDEISFSEWLGLLTQSEVARAKEAGKAVKPDEVVRALWLDWLKKHRPGSKPADYWRAAWGALDPAGLRPDSSAAAAAENPRLYVDSLRFYEETAIAFVAGRMKAVKAALGNHVLCGANYSCHPFYYPTTTMYVRWFRGGAADLGRHSEYFWQVAQPGPMINGYIAEHFRAGMRDNPRAVLRQYTMPHAPGNTDASFLRSAFSHLAHGAKMLDFFGIGMNETFTENHIDHRAHGRYVALRDVTHAVGLVEDLLPQAQAVRSPVAVLVSESTERWDFAGVATDRAGHAHFGPDFRKTRLCHHLERLGLWQALTFAGVSPDLLIEEDLRPEVLKQHRVLVLVGDCLPPELAPRLEAWVKEGGVLLATAGAGRLDPYRQPTDAFARLLGLESRNTDLKTSFFRPRQELPFLKPLAVVEGEGWKMPVLAVRERITPAPGVEVLARFQGEGGPALLARAVGKGRVYYLAAWPGVASLWAALQPPLVPDRGPGTHSVPTAFDPGARAALDLVLKAAGVEPLIEAGPALIDARLLEAPAGYVLPLASYSAEVGRPATLKVRVGRPVKKLVSACHGQLPVRQEGGVLTIQLPRLEYGDVLRLETR